MLDKKEQKRISKRLSLHLRHNPQGLGITLEDGGWVDVAKLLDAFSKKHFAVSLEDLQEVVRDNDKQRFGFDESGTKIRAHQGHSAEVDLELEPRTPPHKLYHGTAQHSLEPILKEGLKSMKRQHVHLSTNIKTMMQVAGRHGKPVLLEIDAKTMHEAGHSFYQSDNGIWLADAVPNDYIEVKEGARKEEII